MKNILLIFTILVGNAFAQSGFYYEYWAEFDKNISNQVDDRWRVNDPERALHPVHGHRNEALANGLALIDIPENLFELSRTELYLELWGGHRNTTSKRVSINGKGSYDIPGFGTENGNCTYAYPALELKTQHLVTGKNALLFSCERPDGLWGHFILDNISVRCFLKPDHKNLIKSELDSFKVLLKVPSVIDNEKAGISLLMDKKYSSLISDVEYFAKYSGYDDNGNGIDDDWHGFTYKRKYTNNVGVVEEYPYSIIWNTEMIPDQSKPIQFRAIISFKNGMKFLTEPIEGSVLLRDDETVTLFYCNEIPIPFWSRVNNLNIAKTFLPVDFDKIIKTELLVKVWDGGEGDIKEPFKLNGHPYSILSGWASHEVVSTKVEVPTEHLTKGWNEFNLLSDTEHHGIEMLLPGPAIIIRSKK